jgi:hypothetical protein
MVSIVTPPSGEPLILLKILPPIVVITGVGVGSGGTGIETTEGATGLPRPVAPPQALATKTSAKITASTDFITYPFQRTEGTIPLRRGG